MNKFSPFVVISAASVAFNFALLLFCLYVTYALFDFAGSRAEQVTQIIDMSMLKSMITSLDYTIAVMKQVVGTGYADDLAILLLSAWGGYVGAIAFAWMSVLGIRWLSHLLRRVLG